MKVNFIGRYEEVMKWVTRPTQDPARGEGEFRKLLSDSLPSTGQKPSVSNTLNSSAIPQEELVMARYNFTPPNAVVPPPQLSSPAMPVEVPVKEPTPEIKPPVVVSAKRVPATRITPEEQKALHDLIDHKGRQHGMDPALSLAVARAESSFNPQAVSSDGHYSKGLFQLLDSTGKHLKDRLDIDGKYNPFNPELNAELGVNYLRYLHDIFSKNTDLPGNLVTTPAADSMSLEKLAVAAFNAGEGRVASAQARAQAHGKDPSKYYDVEPFLPESTQQYVQRVVRFRDEFERDNYG